MPVTDIGENAFYGNHAVKRIQLPKQLKSIGGHAFAECRFLEQMEFPDGTERIGDYSFYNCIRLTRVVIPFSMRHMGFGAFKNDTDLTDIHVFTKQGMESDINTILSETTFEQTVSFHYLDGNVSKLVFTEFFFEETANEEARQFNHKTYGSGSLYRNCISGQGIDYLKYDEIFDLTVHRDEPKTIMDIALKRLEYPYELCDKAKKNYIAHLKTMAEQLIPYMIETKRWSQFDIFNDGAPIPKDVIEKGIEYGRQQNAAEFVSILMQYKNRHYPAIAKTFEL